MEQQNELAVKIAVDAWKDRIKQANNVLSQFSDEQLSRQIAPGKNTGVYVLGHLVATHDAMLPLLFDGPRLYPELEEIFQKNPDNAGLQKPSLAVIKENWSQVNLVLANKFLMSKTDNWFSRHNSISEDEFAKEPHRNKLSVLTRRTVHLAHHLGQLYLLK